jgi:hypothetical protein
VVETGFALVVGYYSLEGLYFELEVLVEVGSDFDPL